MPRRHAQVGCDGDDPPRSPVAPARPGLFGVGAEAGRPASLPTDLRR